MKDEQRPRIWNFSEALKWNYLMHPVLIFSLAASKISICLLLLRVLYFPYAAIAILTKKDLRLPFHRKIVLGLLISCGVVLVQRRLSGYSMKWLPILFSLAAADRSQLREQSSPATSMLF